MKHLDEGTLQAWLDMPRSGLDASEVAEIERHLADCDACAAQLEGLRGSDDRVHALLAGGVDRDVERPPFQDVVARARGRDQARRGLRRLNRLAWAASIVVAIGVGWMTNEIYRDGPPSSTPRVPAVPGAEAQEELASEAPAPTSDDDVAAEERAAGGTGSGAAQQAPAAPRATAPPAAVAEVEPAAGTGRAEESRRFAEPSQPAVVADADAMAPPSDDDARVSDTAAGAAAPAAPTPDAPPAAARRSPADAVAGDELRAYQDSALPGRTAVTGVVRDERGLPVPSVQVYVEDLGIGVLTREDGSYSLLVPDGDSLRLDVVAERIGYRTETHEVVVAGGGVASADFSLEEEVLELQEVVVTGTAQPIQRRAIGNSVQRLTVASPFAWEPEDPEGAEAALGRPPLRVPDLRVVSLEAAETDDAEPIPVLRLRQALGDDGTILTLVQGLADGAREGWQVPAEGAIESRRVDGLLVTGTAPVAADSLRALLEALR